MTVIPIIHVNMARVTMDNVNAGRDTKVQHVHSTIIKCELITSNCLWEQVYVTVIPIIPVNMARVTIDSVNVGRGTKVLHVHYTILKCELLLQIAYGSRFM